MINELVKMCWELVEPLFYGGLIMIAILAFCAILIVLILHIRKK